MARRTLDERLRKLSTDSFKAELRYRRAFDREIEKEFDRYRTATVRQFKTAEKGKPPRTILCEGDSWCRYVIGFAVPWQLEKLDRRNHIMEIGSPGDTVSEMLSGKEAKRLRRYLKSGPSRGRKFDVMYFSGGGNDLLGKGGFARFLKPYKKGMTAAQVIHTANLNRAFDLIEGYYEKLVDMRDDVSPKTLIFLNAYDFAQASNKGVCGRPAWLFPHLDDAGVPDRLHEDVVAEFLTRFERRLITFANRMGKGTIIVAETQGTLNPGQWENEIHPTKRGFKKIAEAFQELLEKHFP